jgi:hypothetical protein
MRMTREGMLNWAILLERRSLLPVPIRIHKCRKLWEEAVILLPQLREIRPDKLGLGDRDLAQLGLHQGVLFYA